MILAEARQYAETFAQQPVKDAVVTVPPFFNQAERRAMATAVRLAGMNLLQVPYLKNRHTDHRDIRN